MAAWCCFSFRSPMRTPFRGTMLTGKLDQPDFLGLLNSRTAFARWPASSVSRNFLPASAARAIRAAVLKEFSWERMIAAVEDVRERACRATAALRQAGIPHVVVGGNAVAAWVARVDAEAVRNTKDVNLLVRRQDLSQIIPVLQAVGFLHQNVNGIDLFLDGPQGSVCSALHLVYAGEKVKADDL